MSSCCMVVIKICCLKTISITIVRRRTSMNPRIYLLALGTLALGTDVFVMASVLPAIAHDRNVSVETAGLLVTVFSLVYGFGAPFLAMLTSQISRRTLLLA